MYVIGGYILVDHHDNIVFIINYLSVEAIRFILIIHCIVLISICVNYITYVIKMGDRNKISSFEMSYSRGCNHVLIMLHFQLFLKHVKRWFSCKDK